MRRTPPKPLTVCPKCGFDLLKEGQKALIPRLREMEKSEEENEKKDKKQKT
jgi:hypothetical protein